MQAILKARQELDTAMNHIEEIQRTDSKISAKLIGV